jgi:hypothetical protein
VKKRNVLGLGSGAAAVVGAAVVMLTVVPQKAAPAPRPTPTATAAVTRAETPYARAVDVAHKYGLRVWIDADLVKRWKAGPQSLNEGAMMVGSLARRPGVVGIKIADELGYHDGLDTPDKIRKFLADARAALARTAPGKPLLVDAMIPELGCMPNFQPPLRWATICAAQTRGKFPQLALDQFEGYLRDHLIDVLDLSTGLMPERTYAGWGVDPQVAQRTAWQEVRRRDWASLVQLQSRKALAHPGRYTDPDTAQNVATYVDVPLAEGAEAVDIWTWRQAYRGDIYRLLDPGLQRNQLWIALVERRSRGDVLFTHLSPRSVEISLDNDMKVISEAFTDLFVAAGTG